MHGGRRVTGDNEVDAIPDHQVLGQEAGFVGVALVVDDDQLDGHPFSAHIDAAKFVDILGRGFHAENAAGAEAGVHARLGLNDTDLNSFAANP
jgi:hypothetical protein